jgi:hypothetical protein
MGWVIFTAIITSILTSLAVWRFYINWQYYRSTAGQRLNQVIEAMLYVLENDGKADDATIVETLNTLHRNSLGAISLSLFKTFKANDQVMTNLPRILAITEKNFWEVYDSHIRPVLTDINNNSFFGWLPGVPNVERLLTLQQLCFQLEKYIAHLELLDKRGLLDWITPIDRFRLQITPANSSKTNSYPVEVRDLLQANQYLAEIWIKWIALITALKNRLYN